ncbi:MAG: alkaline phosphatase [Candidatus Hodarchaeales archaeon]
MRIQKSKILLILGLSLILINVRVAPSISSLGIRTHTEVGNTNNDGLSVILMIGDGMGFEHVKLAQWVEKGVNGTLNMQNLPIKGKVVTQNIVSSITDSAASATAIATGYKAHNSIISKSLSGIDLVTILELSKQLNKSTGIITTTEVTHATPAAFYSHTLSRDNEYEIGQQLITSGIDTIMGGGKNKFAAQVNKIQNQGYAILENRSDLLSSVGGKIFGLFTEGAFPYEQNRDRELVPSLAEMTEKSIEILSQDESGFFLLVEGGQIDWASHVTEERNAVLETIEFDKAVKTAIDYVETRNDTILIVTADHETGGLMVSSETLTALLPHENNTEEQNEVLRISRTSEISLSWSSGGHSNANVPIFAYGNNLELIENSTIDNTQIHLLMKNYLMPFDRGKPAITILSPINQSYDESNVVLSLDTNESLPWIAYSLNNGPNVTFPSLTKFLNLANGKYNLKVYGNDTMNNSGTSEVYFTINTSGENSTTPTTESSADTATSGFGIGIMIPLFLMVLLSTQKRRFLDKKK